MLLNYIRENILATFNFLLIVFKEIYYYKLYMLRGIREEFYNQLKLAE